MIWSTFRMRSIMNNADDLGKFPQIFLVLLAIFVIPFSHGATVEQDVIAINSLYSALGSPLLPGWMSEGGDPCSENWQGVHCVGSNITEIILNAANLGGKLGDELDTFTSITSISFSNNHIGGSIPTNLPPTLKHLFLSANQFTGSIPASLSTLTLLLDMSLDYNFLSGEIPDSFQVLSGLVNLDLSFNNLSGHLPPSMESLSSLTTLHVQNNQLSGELDVLQGLPLKDLNIENNLFSGPVPESILRIPTLKKDGNPFNTSISPSLSPSPPPQRPFFSEGPTSEAHPGKQANKTASQNQEDKSPSIRNKKSPTAAKIAWIAIASILAFIIFVLIVMFLLSKCLQSRSELAEVSQRPSVVGKMLSQDPEVSSNKEGHREKPRMNDYLIQPDDSTKRDFSRTEPQNQGEEHKVDVVGSDGRSLKSFEKIVVNPIESDEATPPLPPPLPPKGLATLPPSPPSKSFSIAALQQYTNSFGQENLIGSGMLGAVYRAELPNGKLLAIKKLDKVVSMNKTDDDFLELVAGISTLQHPNVVRFVGYCQEHGQRLLVYDYCTNGTLYDALHCTDELNEKLSWNSRIKIALGIARALEYLHEACDPPVVHRNFKSANILLCDNLDVRVSDCGLAPLLSSGTVSQLSGQLLASFGHAAPEFNEFGTYTYHSDIFSFGVVMLELLTGRKSFDKLRPRTESLLVRWAIPQLHDIDALSKMVDPSLRGACTAKSLSQFADIVELCLQAEPEFRPPMSDIVQKLQRMMPNNDASITKDRNSPGIIN